MEGGLVNSSIIWEKTMTQNLEIIRENTGKFGCIKFFRRKFVSHKSLIEDFCSYKLCELGANIRANSSTFVNNISE